MNDSNIKETLDSITNLGFVSEMIKENIFKISKSDSPQYVKYIIIEPIDIYRSTDQLVKFIKSLNESGLSNVPTNNVLRLAPFTPYSGLLLGSFITEKDISVNINLAVGVSFKYYPADFNYHGLQMFVRYFETISDDIISDFRSYFLKEIERHHGFINSILPAGAIRSISKELNIHRCEDMFEEILKELT